jgi:prepilin-type N-terminal cleavage/methylation domain-containing protein
MPTPWRTPRWWHVAPKRSQFRARRAFTLAEILLVMAVLVVIASITVPIMKGALENYRLRKSADSMRSAFASARGAAARTGMTYIFQYTPGTAEYTIQPWSTGDEFLEISAAPTIDMGGASTAAAPAIKPLKTSPLPEGILFHGSVTDSSLRDLRTISGSGDNATALGSAPQGAPPILFYSDGSSSNATLVLKNNRGSYVEIKLRGLTGHSTASNLLSANQLSGNK